MPTNAGRIDDVDLAAPGKIRRRLHASPGETLRQAIRLDLRPIALEIVDLVGDVQREVESDGPDQSSHDPARITFWTAYSSSSSTMSARFPTSSEPTSYQPKVWAGVVDAIRDASTSDTPALTALR